LTTTACVSRIDRSDSVRDGFLEDAFARRDAAGYDAAYRIFGSRMYTTALRLLRDSAAARECVHDVLLHLWRRGNAYDTRRGSLEAFLVACTRNQALTQLRSATRRSNALTELDAPAEYAMEVDPIERERIAKALSELTHDQANVVRLAYYRGFTLAEIAEELNTPIGTIKSRLGSALRALRAALVPERSR
jgi:RNA polymerase sigma-70 factor, ECF subfamily